MMIIYHCTSGMITFRKTSIFYCAQFIQESSDSSQILGSRTTSPRDQLRIGYGTVDISSLKNGAYQELCFFNDLDRSSPNFAMYDSFHLQNETIQSKDYTVILMMTSCNIFDVIEQLYNLCPCL